MGERRREQHPHHLQDILFCRDILKDFLHNVSVEAGLPSSPVHSIYAGFAVDTVLQNCLMNVLDLH